jgi:hypothetical protein
VVEKAKGGLPPGVYTVDIRHDDWCDQLAGKGPCNCSPEVGDPKLIFQPEDNIHAHRN